MKKKIVGIFVCMLLIATIVFPVAGTMIKQNNIYETASRGEAVRQLPYNPDDPKKDCWGSCLEPFLQVSYENFFDVGSPICSVHWWGHIGYQDWETGKFTNREYEGMTFDIIFYEDAMGKPGNEICSYEDIVPIMVNTGIIYRYPWAAGKWDMNFFKYDLNPCCNLSNGWVSIRNSNSPNGCCLAWATSPDGDGRAFMNFGSGCADIPDLALLLSDDKEVNLDINVKGGFGCTIEITNSGTETLTDVPVYIIVSGGLFRRINVHFEEVISSIEPGGKTSISTGSLFGLGKIALGVIAGDIAEFYSGRQLLIFSMVI
jgi:hypothetical protein